MQDDALEDRIRKLEARVAALERRDVAGPEPAPAEPPRPPAPVAPAPSPPIRQQPHAVPAGTLRRVASDEDGKRRDLERFFGLAVLGRVGIAALVLAAAYFGQLGWGHLPPFARVLSVYGLAAVLFGLGARLRTKVALRYTALLWGGCVALTYVAGVLAHQRYDLLGPLGALLALLASGALGQVLARHLQIEALATVALGGAYAAPALVDAGSTTPTSLFVLVLALHAWAAWTERRWGWYWSRALAVVASVVLACGWYASRGLGTPWSVVLHCEVLLLGLCAPELFDAFRTGSVVRWRWTALLAGASLLQAYLLVWTGTERALPAFGVFVAVVCGAAGAALSRRAPALGPGLARLGTAVLAPGAWLLADTLRVDGVTHEQVLPYRLGAVVLAAAVLFAVRPWTKVADLGVALAASIAGIDALNRWPVNHDTRLYAAIAAAVAVALVVLGRSRLGPCFGVLLGAVVTLVGWWPARGTFADTAHWIPLALAAAAAIGTIGATASAARRDRRLGYVATALLVVLGIVWLNVAFDPPLVNHQQLPLTPMWNWRAAGVAVVAAGALLARRVQAPSEPAVRALLAAVALVLVYVGGLLEVLDVVADSGAAWRAVASSLYSLTFAAALLTAGFVRGEAALRWCGLVGFALVAGKVTLFDLNNVDTPLRVLATGVLGGVLLVGAWAYSRRRDGLR